ncbi:hypothetical protein LCGC14_1678100 [marine sediment metagenome]|uniref:Uncharacterized protein n=1 Tax=marine sediment metagenome TaxID=412755 RepID=A0A0F9HPW7_9ZZZZ
MKTRTVTQRIGEWLGPVDWGYEFTKHDWSESRGGHNPTLTPESVQVLQEAEGLFNEGKTIEVWCYDMWRKVIKVGMYDGWPYWEPTPTYLLASWLGNEPHSFLSVSKVRVGTHNA